ncbi:MAG: LLM class flavin-dependent oxidoreductase [Actinomycetota bacterium]
MHEVDIGVQLVPGGPREIVRQAIDAESLGFRSVWIADHLFGAGRDRDWPVPEIVATLGAVAMATQRIRIGTCVLSLLKRDPALVAHSSLTLAELSNGRFDLGVGTGFGPDLRAFGIDLAHPAARLEESLEVIRALFGSGVDTPVSHDGTRFHLQDAFLNVPGVTPPPIYVASIGPRTLDITARLGDGWLPFGLTPSIYSEYLSAIRPERADFVPGIWIPAFIQRQGVDASAEAEAAGRLYLSMAPNVLRSLAPGVEVASSMSATSWTESGARQLAESIPPDVARGVVLWGSPEDLIDQILGFIRSGCRRFVVGIKDNERRGADLELLAREVLPYVGDVGLAAKGD